MVETSNFSQTSDVEMPSAKQNSTDILVQEQEEFYETAIKTGKDVRQSSEMLFLRNFNNFIKSLLIAEYTYKQDYLSILDLGCGKGGDLMKWEKAKIAHYVGSDLSKTSVEEAQHRHDGICKDRRKTAFPAVFIVSDMGGEQNTVSQILKTV